jgi:hypothetical protein
VFLEGSKAQASVASRAMTERNSPAACLAVTPAGIR